MESNYNDVKASKPSPSTTTLKQLTEVLHQVVGWSTHQQQAIEDITVIQEALDIPFSRLVLDSRALANSPASLQTVADAKAGFVLLKSQTQPITASRSYAETALKNAAFILSEIDPQQLNLQSQSNTDCPLIYVANIRDILGSLLQLSLLLTNSPAATDVDALSKQPMLTADALNQHLPKVVGITGTNGKTTISQLVAQLCENSKQQGLQHSAVMGTAGNGRLNNLIQASHTTGDALAVQTFLQQMAEEGIDVLALEASSHGLDQQRLQSVPVKVAIYTNLSRDHLDYHPDMASYASAKARLFNTQYFPSLTHAIINLDDEFAELMINTAKQSNLTVWTYSLQPNSDATFMAKTITPSLLGVRIELTSKFGNIELNSPLLGMFNVANLLAALAGVLALGIDFKALPSLVEQLHGANGRMQRVTAGEPTPDTEQNGVFIVDYAHTPDALKQVLTSLKTHCNGDLWAVFGCGGDRDRGKRPLMAQAGLAIADRVILTSDNPRSEDPELILDDMQQGMTDEQYAKTKVVVDRREAIEYAVANAGLNDIVVIAGKGHETYQEINGVRHDFDDVQVLKKALQATNS